MDTDIIRLYVINTGGTLGMVPQDPNDPESPLRPAKTGKDYQHRDVVEL